MNNTVKNIVAVIVGVIVGWGVNGGIISISGSIIPYPNGYDMSSPETMKSTFHLLESKHFIMPWIAHALGTLFGAFVAVKIAATNHLRWALLIAAFFLIGGITMVTMMPSTPLWFAIVDLAGAYLPMGWLAHNLAKT